ncbi:MAG TPA: SAM-dependent chlorinase/fluorinase [Gemmatimonadaceae bacterium]|nr:SAM-dependent chlorinase/fluorinase [Gemmatimonadaceae bacterium]
MHPLITLMTDFGTADGYVGEIKGVLLSQAPSATLVDITHDIAPQDVQHGRLTLARVWRHFPAGTVHLAVVDPGVGSTRSALAVESDGSAFVGPDNGVLSPALLVAGARAVSLPIPRGAAPTFHGRDVFAPAAAMLANGTPIEHLGSPAPRPIVLRTPEPERQGDGTLVGEIIAIDRFGNAITNLVPLREGVVEAGGASLHVATHYAAVERGESLAVVGSSGLIEIAVRDGSAAVRLGLRRGDRVALRARA